MPTTFKTFIFSHISGLVISFRFSFLGKNGRTFSVCIQVFVRRIHSRADFSVLIVILASHRIGQCVAVSFELYLTTFLMSSDSQSSCFTYPSGTPVSTFLTCLKLPEDVSSLGAKKKNHVKSIICHLATAN